MSDINFIMIKKQFLWGFAFEVDPKISIYNLQLENLPKDEVKWEKRFFWPESQEVVLHGLGDDYLNLSQYKFKLKYDEYILQNNKPDNIKIRKDIIVYKPLILEENNCYAYGKKEKYDISKNAQAISKILPVDTKEPDAHLYLDQIKHKYKIIPLQKEAVKHKIAAPIKGSIEFSRICIEHTYYHSFCIEAHNKDAVQRLADMILPNQQAIDYISFLKGLYL